MSRGVSRCRQRNLRGGATLVALASLLIGPSVPALAQEGPAADLVVAQSVPSSTVTSGDNGAFTISITNLGPADATGVTVVNRLSPRSSYVSAVASQGTCSHSNGIVTCELGDLATGSLASITLVAQIGSGTNAMLANVMAN